MQYRAVTPIAFVLVLAGWRAHPIHAARVELEATQGGLVSAVVHVYRDDLPTGINPAFLDSVFDHALVVTDGRGRRVTLRTTGVATEGDRLRITLAGTVPAQLTGGRIALTLLQDRFADQVNVVDARIQGRRAQLVFLRGDGSQLLP